MVFLVVSGTACGGRGYARHLAVQKPMTWECASELATRDYPDAQPVRLRYVEKSNYYEVVSGKGLCDRLTASAQRVVAVDFDAWGDWWHGLVGFEVLAIDGEKIVRTGGPGGSGMTGEPGPHPLAQYFQ